MNSTCIFNILSPVSRKHILTHRVWMYICTYIYLSYSLHLKPRTKSKTHHSRTHACTCIWQFWTFSPSVARLWSAYMHTWIKAHKYEDTYTHSLSRPHRHAHTECTHNQTQTYIHTKPSGPHCHGERGRLPPDRAHHRILQFWQEDLSGWNQGVLRHQHTSANKPVVGSCCQDNGIESNGTIRRSKACQAADWIIWSWEEDVIEWINQAF